MGKNSEIEANLFFQIFLNYGLNRLALEDSLSILTNLGYSQKYFNLKN